MAKNLTTAKLSALARTLTGKEAALLVIDYQTREIKNKKDYEEEVKVIASTIGYEDANRRQEYIFYHSMWRNSGFYSLDLQTTLMSLEIYTWRLEAIKQYVLDNTSKFMISRFMNTLPKYVTQTQFDDLYLKHRKEMLQEQLPIESIAEYEAFRKLQEEGLVPDDTYLQDNNVFSKDRKLKVIFDKYVISKKKQLEKTIKSGTLQETKVKDKSGWYHNGTEYIGQRAITGESWYHYKNKLDSGYNELLENKGRLVEFYEGDVAIAKGFSSQLSTKNKTQCWAESRRQNMIKSLRDDLVIDIKNKEVYLDKIFDPMLQKLVKEINECIVQAVNYWEALKKVQSELFDNKIELERLTDDSMKETVEEPRKVLSGLTKGVKQTFEIFVFGGTPKLKNENKYKIIDYPKPDKEFVDEQFKWLVGLAEKESGFVWKK